jgi:Tat protein translocase TatB subunit
LLIAVVALIVIGPEQLPTVMRALAKTLRELRAAANEVMRELEESIREDEPPKPRPAAVTPREAPEPEETLPPETGAN